MSEKRIYDTPIYSELTAMPAVPPTGFWKIYPKAAGWYILDDLGTETLLGTGGSGHIISEEGSPLPAQPILNFVGAGVTVTNGTGETIVTITSGGTTIAGLTQNYLTKANATGDNILDSVIYDNGTNIGIGTALPTVKLHVIGDGIFNNGQLTRVDMISSGGASDTTLRLSNAVLNNYVNIIASVNQAYIDMRGSGARGINFRDSADNVSFSFNEDTFNQYIDYRNDLEFRNITSGLIRATLNAAGNFGIGTTAPTKKLHIVDGSGTGGFRLEDGTEGSGKVLTSNATGVGTWQFAPGGVSTLSITTINAGDYSILTTDQYIGKTDVSPGGDIITLPTIASSIGQLFYIADESGLIDPATTNTIAAQGGEFIDGAPSVEMTTPYGSVILFNNGTFWKTF